MQDATLRRREGGTIKVSGRDLTRQACEFEGSILQGGDPAYADAAAIWNGMVSTRPGVIMRCASMSDVASAVRFARQHDLLAAVRGGGHNVAGTATCEDGLVIDLTELRHVTVDAKSRTATAQGGATWADLDAATQQYGLAAPGGLVSKTGVAGLTLGGGLGWLRRKHGMSCDSLIAAEIVTADGDVRTASADENSELFWALRGGGGNFGVVSRFTFAVHPVGPEVYFGFVLYPAEKGAEVLKGWRAFCETAPDEVSSIVLCGTVPNEEAFDPDIHGRSFVALAAMYAGPVKDGEQVLRPLRALGTPLADMSGAADYAEVQTSFDGDYPDGLRYYWKSVYVDRLDDEAIDMVLKLAAERPSPLTTVDVWQMGGAIARFRSGASAVTGRRAPYLIGVESNWESPDADDINKAWTREACDRLAPWSSGTGYVNFEPDTSRGLPPETGVRQRLARIKRRYDPDNLFRVNHNIVPQ